MTSVKLDLKYFGKVDIEGIILNSNQDALKDNDNFTVENKSLRDARVLVSQHTFILSTKETLVAFRKKSFVKCFSFFNNFNKISSFTNITIYDKYGQFYEVFIIGCDNGYIKVFLSDSTELLSIKFDESMVIKLLCLYKEKNKKLVILHQNCIIVIEDHHLYHILNNCKEQCKKKLGHDSLKILTEITSDEVPHKKFWIKSTNREITDLIICANQRFTTYEQLRLISCYETFRSYTPPSDSFDTFVISGGNPFIGFYFLEEDDDGTLLHKNLSDQLISATSRIKGTLNTSRNLISANIPTFLKSGKIASHTSKLANTLGEATHKVISKLTLGNIYLRFGIHDTARIGMKLYLSPDNKFLACTDNHGRVCIVDARSYYILYLLKGYRDAYCTWICGYEDDRNNKSFSNSLETSYPYLLLIYAPRRGLLEIWAVTYEDIFRIHAKTVMKNGLLMESLDFSLGKCPQNLNENRFGNDKDVPEYYFFENNGSIYQMIFDSTIFDKNTRHCLIDKSTVVLKKNEMNLRLKQIITSKDLNAFGEYLSKQQHVEEDTLDLEELNEINWIVLSLAFGCGGDVKAKPDIEFNIQLLKLLTLFIDDYYNKNLCRQDDGAADKHEFLRRMFPLYLFQIFYNHKNLLHGTITSHLEPVKKVRKNRTEESENILKVKIDILSRRLNDDLNPQSLYKSIVYLSNLRDISDFDATPESIREIPIDKNALNADLIVLVKTLQNLTGMMTAEFNSNVELLQNMSENLALKLIGKEILYHGYSIELGGILPWNDIPKYSLVLVCLYWLYQEKEPKDNMIFLNEFLERHSKAVVENRNLLDFLIKNCSNTFNSLTIFLVYTTPTTTFAQEEEEDVPPTKRMLLGLKALLFLEHLQRLIVTNNSLAEVQPARNNKHEMNSLNGISRLKLSEIDTLQPILEDLASCFVIFKFNLLNIIWTRELVAATARKLPTEYLTDPFYSETDPNLIPQISNIYKVLLVTLSKYTQYHLLPSPSPRDSTREPSPLVKKNIEFPETSTCSDIDTEDKIACYISQLITYLVVKIYFERWHRELLLYNSSSTDGIDNFSKVAKISNNYDSNFYGIYRSFTTFISLSSLPLSTYFVCYVWRSIASKLIVKFRLEMDKTFDLQIDDSLCLQATSLNRSQFSQVLGITGLMIHSNIEMLQSRLPVRNDSSNDSIIEIDFLNHESHIDDGRDKNSKLDSTTTLVCPSLIDLTNELAIPTSPKITCDLLRLYFFRHLSFLFQAFTFFDDLEYVNLEQLFPYQFKILAEDYSKSNYLDGKSVILASSEISENIIQSSSEILQININQFLKKLIKELFKCKYRKYEPIFITPRLLLTNDTEDLYDQKIDNGGSDALICNYLEMMMMSGVNVGSQHVIGNYGKEELKVKEEMMTGKWGNKNFEKCVIRYWLTIIFNVWFVHQNPLPNIQLPFYYAVTFTPFVNIEKIILYTISVLYAENQDESIQHLIQMFPEKRQLIACQAMNTAGIRIINFLEDADDEIYQEINEKFSIQIQMWLESLDPTYDDVDQFKDASTNQIIRMLELVINILPKSHTSNQMAQKIIDIFKNLL